MNLSLKTWNWQQSDWPNFSWNAARLARAENQFLVGAGTSLGAAKYLDRGERERLLIEILGREALTTSEIEGEILDRDSVQSSLRRQFGLAGDRRDVTPAEQGIAEMMVDLYRNFADPLTHETLFRWHIMIANGRRDLKDVGRYRTHDDEMQVVSGPIHDPVIHFEAPPSAIMQAEMEHFLEWFQRTGPGGTQPLPLLTRAGIAHLWFVSIHPFEDGNGRLARAIAEKALAQSLGQPSLIAMAATILLRRKHYYSALEAANKRNEITGWLAWFGATALEAQARAIAGIGFLIDKARLLDRLRGQLNERQQKVLLRMLAEGPEGFTGGLSAANYVRITGASQATTTRDLANMVFKEMLVRRGERRHARYYLTIALRPVDAVTIDDDGRLSGIF